MKAPILVRCRLCDEEWGPADLNAAGICPGCVEDLTAAPAKDKPEPAEYNDFLRRERERQLREAAERQRIIVGRELRLPYHQGAAA